MNLNQEFLDLYNSKIRDTLMANYNLISKKLETSGMEKEIKESTHSTYSKYLSNLNNQMGVMDGGTDKDVSLKSCTEEEGIVLEFITLSLISGYYHLSNIDINVNSMSEFGFLGCENCILVLLKSINMGLSSDDCIKDTAFNSILSVLRNDTYFSDYMAQELYVKDIKHIERCLEPKTEKAYLSEEDEMLVLDKLGASVQIALNDLRSIYKSIMMDAFGLERYKGVFTFNRMYGVLGLNSAYGITAVEPKGVLADYFAEPLMKKYNVFTPSGGIPDGDSGNEVFIKYSDRQFDCDIIYKGYIQDIDKPVYFPRKMLEIVNAMKYTNNIQTQVYKPTNKGKNLDTYLGYLCGNKSSSYTSDDYKTLPPMGREILKALCCGLSTKLSDYNIKNSSDLTIGDILDNRDNKDLSVEFTVFAEDFLTYCMKCFTTCFVLTSINNKREHIYDFRIRTCYPKSVPYSNKDYIGDVGCEGKYRVEALIAEQAEYIENVEVSTIKYKGYLQDYSYCSNPKLAYGRPLFAYKALEKMAEQGRHINWDSILLGKTEAGGLVTSEKSGRGASKIHLQDVHIHYLIAGSRSGKGVTGYNILGTALVSGLPVFYMDRKPDTASIMKSISPNMFAINGGDYKPDYDTTKSFVPSNLPFKIPPYLESYFAKDRTLKGDYAYLRGMLFAINLAVFMDNSVHKDSPIYQKLYKKIEKGYFIVLDEFTNFTNEFLQKCMVTFNDDNSLAVFNKLPKVDTYKEIVSKGFSSMKASTSKLEKLKDKLEEARASGKKGSVSEGDIQAEVEKFNDAIEDLSDSAIDLGKLYWNAFYDKYTSVFQGWTALKKAGAGVMLNTHLFIIGQDLDPILFDSTDLDPSQGKVMFNRSAIDSKVAPRKGVPSNLFYKFLGDNPSDIILGYQPPDKGKPEYLAQGEKIKNKANALLTEDKRFFCYKRMPEGNKTEFMYKVANTRVALKTDDAIRNFVNGFEYFKPFLILNTGDIPSEEYLYPNPDDHSDTNIPDGFEEARKVNTGSAQYVAQCITSCNKVGITYDELVEDNPDPNNPNSLNRLVGFEDYMNCLLSSNGSTSSLMDLLGQSGEIANIVVQEILGYDGTFEEYIHDFSAEALFDWRDWDRALGGDNSVKERLKGSFFLPYFTTRSAGGETFASVFKDKLGSLYQYYGDDSSSMGVAQSFERKIVEPEDEEDDIDSEGTSSTLGVSTPTSEKQSVSASNGVSQAQQRASSYYSDNGVENDTVEKSQGFTREMAISFIEQALRNYDRMHQDKPIRHLVSDYEIESLADMFVSIMND